MIKATTENQSVKNSSVLVTLSHETANLISEISGSHTTHLDNFRHIYLKYIKHERDITLDQADNLSYSFDLVSKLIQQLPSVKTLATECHES